MKKNSLRIRLIVLVAFLLSLSACAPEVGSDAWCKAMSEKSTAHWSANEAAEFAKNCVFKTYED